MIGEPAHDEGLAATVVDRAADDAEQLVPPGFVKNTNVSRLSRLMARLGKKLLPYRLTPQDHATYGIT